MTVLAITGHRELEDENLARLRLAAAFRRLQPDLVIQGCAAGIDLLAGFTAIKMGIPVLSAKPWTTHKARREDVDLYAFVIANSWDVYVVTESDSYPGPWVYHKRNEWMVDEADRVLAWWNGQKKGGTFACLSYAEKRQKPVENIFTTYETIRV